MQGFSLTERVTQPQDLANNRDDFSKERKFSISVESESIKLSCVTVDSGIKEIQRTMNDSARSVQDKVVATPPFREASLTMPSKVC